MLCDEESILVHQLKWGIALYTVLNTLCRKYDMIIYFLLFLLGWEWWTIYYQVNLILLSFLKIKVSLTGLSKFKEGASKIQELLSLRKGINLHLQEIKMDLSRGNEKAIGVFIPGSDNKQLGWIPRETISEVQRMGRMEDLRIRLITFKEKDFIAFQ